MEDEQLLRYSRQIMLPQFDISGQQKLRNARALIIGLGGLGSPVSMYLAAAGIGELTLVDYDQVELSNLQRQIVHTTQDIGSPKVESARTRLVALNPGCAVRTLNQRLDDESLVHEASLADVVIDASDNFATRFSVNSACVKTSTALVSGAAIRFEGQVTVFRPGHDDSPCYRCLYPDDIMLEESCSQTGVISPLLGIIGSIQAMEAVKLLTETGETLQGRLLLLDALSMEWNTMRFRKDPQCPVCGQV